MAYVNLSASDKLARSNAFITSIGSSGFLNLYVGTQPATPDLTAVGTLLVSMPLSATSAVATYGLQSATIVAGGTGGTNGTQTLTGTTGTGTKFTVSATVAGGIVTAILSVLTTGSYTVNPTNMNIEPVTGASVTGCTLSLAMTSLITFNAITTTNAVASGTAGWGRLTTSGGIGVVDLDVGITGSGASVQINTATIASGGPVVISGCVFQEA